ncbi:very short patch repair endonuclease [Jannaschia rubra]|uniref:very short patch repair endonuclease n=1 Tax=Jannaschia rubra TaxID=282197 RepID=UPI0006E2BA3B|nr:very short patch repair endonuclease [Jannaschia rubra]MAM39765.1 very short patch repair endonuclease [Erythrobacter sp.]
MDRITPDQRSRNMARIRGRDTKPEVALRSALHGMGLRFRVCRRDLPGSPDVVFPRQRLAVQVRGCFWHQHAGCPAGRLPASRLEYWRPKLEGNVRRDGERDAALVALGWRLIVVWECELKGATAVAQVAARVADAVEHKD